MVIDSDDEKKKEKFCIPEALNKVRAQPKEPVSAAAPSAIEL